MACYNCAYQALAKRSSDSARGSSTQPMVTSGSVAFDSTLAAPSRHQASTADRSKDSSTSVGGATGSHAAGHGKDSASEKSSRVSDQLVRQVEVSGRTTFRYSSFQFLNLQFVLFMNNVFFSVDWFMNALYLCCLF